ncbi:MAG: hypothetical protein J0L88_13910 [Xanthomonadales bacterium]|nr:hypothetical protein [Xanthomonadales bacterium]
MSKPTRWIWAMLACAPSLGNADTTLGYRVEGADCTPGLSSWQFTRSHMRSENHVLGTHSIVIYDHLEKLSHVLNPSNRTYTTSEMDLDAADFAGDVLASMGHHAQKRGGGNVTRDIADCAFLPVDLLRDELPSCKGGDPMLTLDPFRAWDGGRIRVDRDIGTRTVAGIRCTRREHVRDGRRLREDCTASPEALALPPEESKLFERMARHNVAAAKLMFRDGEANMEEASRRLLVVEQICFGGDGAETGRATLQIDHAEIAPSRFEVPAGYVEAIAPGNRPPPSPSP